MFFFKLGFTPIHLSARYGHLEVLEVFKKAQINLRVKSKKLGFTALHVSAYYGETGNFEFFSTP